MRRVIVTVILFTMVSGIFVASHGRSKGSDEKDREMKLDMTTSGLAVYLIKMMPQYYRLRAAARRGVEDLPEPVSAQAPDSATIFNWIEELCLTAHRRPGTLEGHQGEDYVAARFRELELEDVTKDPIDITVWNAESWNLVIEHEGESMEFPCFYVVNTGFTGPQGVSGEMVYVGEGEPEAFEDNPVQGKIVVADVTFPTFPTGILVKLMGGGYYLSDPEESIGWGTKQVMAFVRENFPPQPLHGEPSPKSVYHRAIRHGAAGMILILKDQPSNTNTHYGPYDGAMKPMPALWVGKYDGDRLREMAEQGARATIILEGTKEMGVTHNVWGILPGMSDEAIFISSHHDSPFKGASEDAAGVAQVLAQAWAWSRVPRDERARTILFACTAGHFYGGIGAEVMTERHPELFDRALANVNLEHLGAREVEDKDGEFAFTGNLAVTTLFITPNSGLISTAVRAMKQNQPSRAIAVPSHLLGPVPPGEGGHYYQETGIDIIHWIGDPHYLLTAEDTLDKIDQAQLQNIAQTVTDMVGTLMVMKKENRLCKE
jgi:hypothetical protein